MAVIDIAENAVKQGQLDTEDPSSRALVAQAISEKKLSHYIVRAIDERGGTRPVGTLDDIKETDQRLEFIRPGML